MYELKEITKKKKKKTQKFFQLSFFFFYGLERYLGITRTNPPGCAELAPKMPNNGSKWVSNLESCCKDRRSKPAELSTGSYNGFIVAFFFYVVMHGLRMNI